MKRPAKDAAKNRGGRLLWITFAALFAGCQTHPLLAYRAPLVDVKQLEPGIQLDIRYATPNNFTGRPLYPEARALLLPEPAQALARAHRALKEKGYGILVYDAYRPWRVTTTSGTRPARPTGSTAMSPIRPLAHATIAAAPWMSDSTIWPAAVKS